ncbi:MAG: hypothetical protein ABI705_05520 [Aestuariivirga sp.]
MDPNKAGFDDFYEIAKEVQRLAPNIAISIVTPHDRAAAVQESRWKWPTLTVGIGTKLGKFTPPRGSVMQGRAVKKIEQFARFTSLGIGTPLTARLDAKQLYDPLVWGEFVILKPLPLSLNSTGAGVKLIRTARLNELNSKNGLAAFVGHDAPMLIQTFIDTGPFPTHWRILTLFGHALYSMKFWCPIQRPELTASDEEIENSIIETKHPDLKKSFGMHDMRKLAAEPEMLEFAARVSEAFPTVPLQGIDILQEDKTGRLFALEINGGGNVWHFSSKRGALGRAGGITREDRVVQLGAWEAAARSLIDATMRHAS